VTAAVTLHPWPKELTVEGVEAVGKNLGKPFSMALTSSMVKLLIWR